MLHACNQKFDVTENLENFCELIKAIVAHQQIATWTNIGMFDLILIIRIWILGSEHRIWILD